MSLLDRITSWNIRDSSHTRHCSSVSLLIWQICLSAKKYSRNTGVWISAWTMEFIKQVLPRFINPLNPARKTYLLSFIAKNSNLFPNKPWFLRVCNTSLLKTLWEKEKLLVMSNFSFSHSAFYPFGKLSAIFFQIQNWHLLTLSNWKGLKFVVWERVNVTSRQLNPYQKKPLFLRICSTFLLKTLWKKEKLLVTSNFSFSHRVFYPFRELSIIFVKFYIVVCSFFEFGRD